MKQSFDPGRNYTSTQKAIGYVTRKQATQADYDRVGFMSGLEVHQQLNTREKLFCHCPAGFYQKPEDYDAELIRHMRPTLSELGEYDGTALMEFMTRKQIIYHINNKTACTYDVDDTPPFPLNREALGIALKIALLSKLNIVGEVHISRKQYLDGSIPTGFQRTAIIGVEGEIQLRNKSVRLIQLSIEEDSCREVSDIGHVRVYRTDRLGMPLIETVTYPEFKNPGEVKEGADYIRFLNRSTGEVLTGVGSTRADVNVSCRGGTRVEIKGVAHTGWMPELTHNEVFRQWALLNIRDILKEKVIDASGWKISHKEIDAREIGFDILSLFEGSPDETRITLVNLPLFQGILSHFTQPGKMFGDELSEKIKVVACIEFPNMIHSEMVGDKLGKQGWKKVQRLTGSREGDAQLILYGPAEDIPTALEVIQERCLIAFSGVPNETRKSFKNGTTVFERVLPGADRMYPDTDSAPIPLEDDELKEISEHLPVLVSESIQQLKLWDVPEDTYTYILKNNLVPLIGRAQQELKIPARLTAALFAQTLKHIQGKYPAQPEFSFQKVYELLAFLVSRKLDLAISKRMLLILYQNPNMDYESILTATGFRDIPRAEIIQKLPVLVRKYRKIRISSDDGAGVRWVMGNLSALALGNIPMAELSKRIRF